MPRACVIVLDAVGAGELPDADAYGDEGSDTLGNVARAVGGLDLPNLEALGLGNVEPLEGCPPQPGAPAIAGRLVERSKGKDTTDGPLGADGRRHADGVPDLPARLPARRDRPVHAPDGPRRARQQARLRARRSSRSSARSTSAPGKWIVYTSADSVFQIAAHEETIPLEELYEGCRTAREILTGKHAVGRVIARPFVGEPGNYERHAEPPRLLARAAAAELPHARPRRRPHRCTASGRSPTSSRAATSTSRTRRSRTSRGSSRPSRCCASSTTGSSSRTSSRRTCSGATATTRSTSTAACRTSTGGCPTCSTRCATGDLLILTSDHGCDPTTPSTDHSREHALLLAYVEGRNAAGRIHEGEFADVGATVNAWLGGKSPRRGFPASRSSSREARTTRSSSGASTRPRRGLRGAARRRSSGSRTGPNAGRRWRSTRSREARPRRVLEVGCGHGRVRGAHGRASSGRRSSRSTSRSGWSSCRARAASTRASATSRSCRSRTAEFDCAVATWMLYHVRRPRPRARRARARARARAGGSSR